MPVPLRSSLRALFQREHATRAAELRAQAIAQRARAAAADGWTESLTRGADYLDRMAARHEERAARWAS